ncbi:MAG: flagellar motor switch protein FliN [Acidobacteria bacterium]|nr:flagellar motor switch protein FliN [Acidobacteriota bacterium]
MSANWQEKIESHWLLKAWAQSMQSVLRTFDIEGAGASFDVSVQAPQRQQWTSWERPQWFRQDLDIAPGAECRLGAGGATLSALWALVAGDAGADDQAAAVETWREFLNQASSGAAAALTGHFGRPTHFGPSEASQAPGADWPAVDLVFQDSRGGTHRVAVALNAAAAAGALESTPKLSEPAPPPAAPVVSRETGDAGSSLQLLKDLELDLAVSFGHTTMSLEDTLKLSSGSIVELNRAISDPVELLVNNSVIARGEVVVVDGNYGVRITEIASPRDRVKSFF